MAKRGNPHKSFDTGELDLEFWAARMLQDHFRKDEMKLILFELGVDYEALPDVGKDLYAVEVAAEMKRRKRLRDLADEVARLRPFLRYDDDS